MRPDHTTVCEQCVSMLRAPRIPDDTLRPCERL